MQLNFIRSQVDYPWCIAYWSFLCWPSHTVPRSLLLSVQTHVLMLLFVYVTWTAHRLVPGWIGWFLSEFRIQIASWCKLMGRSCTLCRGWMATFLTNRIEAYLKIKEISTKVPQVPSTKLSAFFFFFLKFALYLAPSGGGGSELWLQYNHQSKSVRYLRASATWNWSGRFWQSVVACSLFYFTKLLTAHVTHWQMVHVPWEMTTVAF